MSKPLVTSRKSLFAAVLILLFSSMLSTGYAGYVSKLPTVILNTFAIPLSRPVGWVSYKIRPADQGPIESISQSEWIQQKEDYETQNRALWAENRDLRERLAAFQEIARVRSIDSIRPIEAVVIDFNNERTNPVMLISQGERSGILGGDPVVFRTNLLGFVEKEPGLLNCKVELVNRPGRKIRVAMQPTGATEFPYPVVDYATAGQDGQTFYVDRPIDHPLEIGHIAWVYDDLHEQAYGFLLGRIVAIQDHPDRPIELDRIIIQPEVPIGRQSRVMVITEREE